MKQSDFTGSCKQRADYAMWTDFQLMLSLKFWMQMETKKVEKYSLSLVWKDK